MKILVTGANGYLGQGVVKALLDNGHSVVAADFKTNYVDIAVVFRQQKRRKVQYEVCKLYPDTSLEEPSR